MPHSLLCTPQELQTGTVCRLSRRCLGVTDSLPVPRHRDGTPRVAVSHAGRGHGASHSVTSNIQYDLEALADEGAGRITAIIILVALLVLQ